MNAAHDLFAYVQGPYMRVDDERTDHALEIVGELPAELHGMFVQNSPNPAFAPPGAHHWFDGDGMVHGVHLEDGTATYRNRYVRTERLAEDTEAGRALSGGILMDFDPDAGHPDRNTANTDLTWHRGRLVASWWLSGDAYVIGTPDLSTKGTLDLGPATELGLAAHPKVDPRTGELVFFGYDAYSARLQHGVIDADGTLVHHAEVRPPGPSLYHDIAITENYTLLLHFPMRFDELKVKLGKRRVRWHGDEPMRIGVVPRRGTATEVRWFEAAPGYCYHTVNAWEHTNERGDKLLTMLACRIDQPTPMLPRDEDSEIPRLFYLRLEPYLHEWTLNLTTGAVSERRLDDVPTEFPRVNDRLLGVKNRFAYHPRVKQHPTLLFDGCIKYDLDAGTSTTHVWGGDRIGAETVFAPRAAGTDEDDGWVITFVTDLATEQSSLVVLDARNIEAGPVAEVKIPRRVPFGFHAEWVPGEQMP